MALFLLLKFAVGRGISDLQVFGDSVFVINWMIGKAPIHNNFLSPLADQLKDISGLFTQI